MCFGHTPRVDKVEHCSLIQRDGWGEYAFVIYGMTMHTSVPPKPQSHLNRHLWNRRHSCAVRYISTLPPSSHPQFALFEDLTAEFKPTKEFDEQDFSGKFCPDRFAL